MTGKSLELKVGIFVLIGLTLLAALMLYFAKGLTLFKPTYKILLQTSNVGGLKPEAPVLMSGVQVGNVEDIQLSVDGKSATVSLRLLERYQIYPDAEFAIDALGFLGDQYVAIRPQKNVGQPLQNGALVSAREPFDLQELARASLGFINRLDKTAEHLNDAIERVDKLVLNEHTLTNLSETVNIFRQVSDRSLETVNQFSRLMETNGGNVGTSLSNLVLFTEQLNELANELQNTVITNRAALGRTMSKLEDASASINRIVLEVEAGRGVAGTLLRDDVMAQNLADAANNLAITASNINARGLWGVLWQKRK